jgi:manganese transport protein
VVGYVDPGNWAASLAGRSKFGYTLLVVVLISNIMAIVLQALRARLTVASGPDLAQACRDAYPRWASYPLWAAAEIPIIATDVAEVTGTAIRLNLQFGRWGTLRGRTGRNRAGRCPTCRQAVDRAICLCALARFP